MSLPLEKDSIEEIAKQFIFYNCFGEFNNVKNRKKWRKKFNRENKHLFLTMKADEKMNTPKVIDNNSFVCRISHFGKKYDVVVE